MDCRDLDDLSHAVVWHLQERVRARRKMNKTLGYRVYPISPDNLAYELRILRNDIRGLLGDLARLGYVEFGDHDEYKSIGVGSEACTCEERRASVAPTTNPYLTRSARSGEEDGQGEESVGPEDPSARNTREARLRKKWELDRERREERLRGIEQKKPQDLNSNDLALLFWDRVKRHSPWASKVPGAVNHRAFGRCLAEWMRDGTPPELIREMIEVFAKDRKMLGDGDVAWKVFINRRALLAKRAANRVEFHAPDDLGWNDLPEDDDDDDLGWGAYLANDSEH